MQKTKKDAEEMLRPVYAAVLQADETLSIMRAAFQEDFNPSTASALINAQAIFINRQRDYIAAANEIIRQGVV